MNFSGCKRKKDLMQPFEKEIVPAFETTKGLKMVDASALSNQTKQAILTK